MQNSTVPGRFYIPGLFSALKGALIRRGCRLHLQNRAAIRRKRMPSKLPQRFTEPPSPNPVASSRFVAILAGIPSLSCARTASTRRRPHGKVTGQDQRQGSGMLLPRFEDLRVQARRTARSQIPGPAIEDGGKPQRSCRPAREAAADADRIPRHPGQPEPQGAATQAIDLVTEDERQSGHAQHRPRPARLNFPVCDPAFSSKRQPQLSRLQVERTVQGVVNVPSDCAPCCVPQSLLR